MKAAVVEGPGRLVVRDVPDPVPGPYQALCRLRYGATCTGTDSHIIAGNFPYLSPYPTIVGHESVGEVVEVGPAVRNYRSGDLVTRVGAPGNEEAKISVTWGGFAEFGIAWDHWAMRADGLGPSEWRSRRVNQLVPRGVDPKIAPMFTTWRETLSYLERLNLPQGFRMLIIGSGGNAFSYAVHARLLGAESVVMIGSPKRSSLADRVGVNGFVDYHTESIADRIREMGFERFDCILDAVGRSGALDLVLPLIAPAGIVAIYGIDDYGKIRLDPFSARTGFSVYNGGYDEAETHGKVSELCLSGMLDASIWYDDASTFALDDIGRAFESVSDRTSLKALIEL